MSTNPTEQRKLYYRQDFAYSTNHLDYEIPDFRGFISAAVPVLVVPERSLLMVGNPGRPLDASSLSSLIDDVENRSGKLLCNDAVSFHRIALGMAENDEELREKVWQLTDSFSLWDVILLEQRLIWATEGRVIDRPDFSQLLTQYSIAQTVSPIDGVREIFQSQFTHLIDGLPFLKNDIAGRRVFREQEYDSPYISAPNRVSARNVHFKERLHVFLPLIEGWQKYGPAGVGLDVQAAIAMYYQNESRCNAASGAVSVYRGKKNGLRDRLARNGLDGCYKTFDRSSDDGGPVYANENAKEELRDCWRETTSNQGYPEPNSGAEKKRRELFRDFLSPAGRRSQRLARQNRRFPCAQDGQLSLNPAHWGEVLPPNGPLRCWADYHAVSLAASFAETRNAALPHEYFPYLKSLISEYADRENLPLLAPLPGHRFLELRIRDLDLLCYLQTHREYEFIHETGRDEFAELNHLVGDIRTSDFATPSEWYSGNFTELLPSLADDEYEKLPYRNLPCDARYSRVCWESSAFYTVYQYFTRPYDERNRFLAAVFGFGHDGCFHENNALTWYIIEDRCEEVFHVTARQSILGFIHGWPTWTIVEHLRSEYGSVIRGETQGHKLDYDLEIERLHGSLLNNFRFRGQVSSFLYANLLPKLCIDPVVRSSSSSPPTGGLPEELLIDEEWRIDEAPRNGVPFDLMLRDMIGDITDRKIIAGENTEGLAGQRWRNFLLPLLDERCRDLGISEPTPCEDLASRLYLTNMISRNGKPGRPVYEVEKPYTCWMETLDDLKKAVAYALLRTGATLVAVSEESFVLDIEENTPSEMIQSMVDTVRRTCESIVGLEPERWGNFVEYHIIGTWPRLSGRRDD